MIFVDTNYFLRFIISENNDQADLVRKLFFDAAEGKKKLFTSSIVFFEIYWVLGSYYKVEKAKLGETLKNILEMVFIEIENRSLLLGAVDVFMNSNVDLEDSYNLVYAKFNHSKDFLTFDKILDKKYRTLKL